MVDDVLLVLGGRYPQFFPAGAMRLIGCYAGWLDLIDELCQALEAYLLCNPEAPEIEVVQVKEKFGELRFYVHGDDRHCRRLIALARARSLITCEVCGANGAMIGDRWVSVRCSDHVQWQPTDSG